ncbi:MAG: hypothetical protein MI740_10390 [Halanaerobiales bacterium]|nr:hypothetical protein [Halanaerobiales bacterium]
MPLVRDYREVGVCALIVAALAGYSTEVALEYIETGEKPKQKTNSFNYIGDDVIDMVVMKVREGKTYKEIAEFYNIKTLNVYSKIRRLKNKRKSEDMYKLRQAGLYYYEISGFYGSITRQAVHQRIQKIKNKEGLD